MTKSGQSKTSASKEKYNQQKDLNLKYLYIYSFNLFTAKYFGARHSRTAADSVGAPGQSSAE